MQALCAVRQNLLEHGGGCGDRNTIIQNGDYGIDFSATGGYAHNVLAGNLDGAVSGSGVQTAGNVCNGAPCP